MSNTTDTARDYCRNIGRELDALDFILAHSSRDLDDETAEAYAEAINELETDADLDACDIVAQYLNETALDLKILRTDDCQQTRVEILRTCGGPHCEITRDSNDGHIVAVTTYDGHDQATIRNSYAALANYLDEIAQ
jgi:hypothetical protein